MLSFIFASLCIVGCVHGSPAANQYFDHLLNAVLPNQIRTEGLDPAPLSNFSATFEDTVTLIGRVKGHANFSGGLLEGLSRVRRYSECHGPHFSFGAKGLNCTIVADKLGIAYQGRLKYGQMPKVSFRALANITTTLLFVDVHQPPSKGASLRNVTSPQLGMLEVDFSGLGPFNRFTKILDNGFRAHVQAEVLKSMSQRFQSALNETVALTPLPN